MWHYHREYLPPKPIDAFVECTSKTFEISGSDGREHTASRWHSSYYRRSGSKTRCVPQHSKRPANALNDFCGRSMASRSRKSSTAQASLREGIGLWRENVSKRWQWRKLTKKLRTYFYPIHVRGIDVHIDKALLWSSGRSSHFWNIHTPPNLKKSSAISQVGCDFIALRPERNTHRPAHERVANLGRLS
ncbi:hypothetical protein EV363DRAFT_1344224 [Boletus edulis]|nr:hypothetical protein EV363DRAFT_1344224 [Boletus edulis]